MSLLDQQYGFFWPKGDGREVSRRAIRIPQARKTVAEILTKTSGRNTVVQAGGHVGLWPLELAKHFETVYTFEPNHENFHCLVRNVTAPNVYPFRAVLGEVHGQVKITRDRPFSGVHYVVPNASGPLLTLRIDDLELMALDAVILDVEGAEWPILKGAVESLKRFKPTVVIENLRLGARLGYGTVEDIAPWLANLGYGAAEQIAKRDLAFRV